MTIGVITTRHGADALERLREVVAEAKSSDRMATVTIVVPNAVTGTVARRHLAHGIDGHSPGIAGVRMTTLPRLAEELAAASLAPRRPATRTILAAAWRHALHEEPGIFDVVAAHAATIEALVRAHRELRDLDREALDVVARGGRVSRDVVRIHRAVVDRLQPDWYDETDLALAAGDRSDLRRLIRGTVILYLPQLLTRAEQRLVDALSAQLPLTAIVGLTGVVHVDGDLLESLGEPRDRAHDVHPPVATDVLTASDSDDEVRCIGRAVLADLATRPAHRIAVLYAAADPYAQTLHERFAAMGITVNGPGVRTTADRAAARMLLELLGLAERDLPRNELFRALSGAAVFDFAGKRMPLSSWERTSRKAGIVSGEDWDRRLLRLIEQSHDEISRAAKDAELEWLIPQLERDIATATALQAFTVELRRRLQAAVALTTWTELSTFALDLLQQLLPSATTSRMPAEEQAATAVLLRALRGLATLDDLERQATLHTVIDVLQLELDSAPGRVGAFGNGVLVAPVSAAIGLELDHVYVIGLAEDLYPGRLHDDALLPDAVRADPASQLPSLRRPLNDRHRALLAAMQVAGRVTVSAPRGDLRRSTSRIPSRWLLPTFRALAGTNDFSMTEWERQQYGDQVHTSSSFAGALLSTELLADAQEWRTRAIVAKVPVEDAVLDAATAMLQGRAGAAFTRYDGNLADVDDLPDLLTADRAIAPTVLEGYAVCPHSYFVKQLLHVRPLEQPEDIVTIRSMDIGTFLHACMDELTAVAEKSGTLPSYGEPWTAEQRALVQRIGRRKAAEFENKGLTGHSRLWAAEQEQLLKDLALMLDDDDKIRGERGAAVRRSELEFGMHGKPAVAIPVDGGRVLMKGSADRVDATADGRLYVIDLKSGSEREFKEIKKGDPLVNGTKLQLPVYAHAARAALGMTDVLAEYWFVRKNMLRINVPLVEVEDRYRQTIGLLATSIRAGVFPNRPPEAPDYAYVQCPYCNPDGIGHGEARERWVRKRGDAGLAGYLGLVEPKAVQE